MAAAGGATAVAVRLGRACLDRVPEVWSKHPEVAVDATLVLAVTLWETGRTDEAVTVLEDALDWVPPARTVSSESHASPDPLARDSIVSRHHPSPPKG